MQSRTDRWTGPVAVFGLLWGASFAQAVTLGRSGDGRFFTIDGAPTYLNGVSYYGGIGITTPSFINQDLDDMVADGFNWIRVWAYWSGTSAVTTQTGVVREPYMSRLKALITECNSRGLVVDVTLHRDSGSTTVPANLSQHLACARTIATQLLGYRNVYIDVANERDVGDSRYVSLTEVGQLIDAIHVIDPGRLCTGSSVPGSQSQLNDFRNIGKMDFIAPHLCRAPGCSTQTFATVRQFVGWMNNLGFRVPVHLQEPFRRDYASYQPTVEDFYRDDSGAKVAEAAGWCLHNQRGFDMSDAKGRIYSQWDGVEATVVHGVTFQIGGTNTLVRHYQAEYAEQLSHAIGRKQAFAWSANVAQDPPGYLNSGPNISTLPAGDYEVVWRMMIDNNTADNEAVVALDVQDADSSTVLASRTIARPEFGAANAYQDFLLPFTYANAGHRLQFRTYWRDKAYVNLDFIEARLAGSGSNVPPVIASVTPNPDNASVGVPYSRQLILLQGAPTPAWSVVQAPAETQVDAGGLVGNWTPGPGDAGRLVTFEIRATNSAGSDTAVWQVEVPPASGVVIARFLYSVDQEGWTLNPWQAGPYSPGVIVRDATNGNPAGNLCATGSGTSNNTDSCTREGATVIRGVSTAGYTHIRIAYDVIAALDTPPPGGCIGSCVANVPEGRCEDKLAVYYSTTGTGGPWTLAQVFTEGVDLPTAWTHEEIDLSGAPAVSFNPGFAIEFAWQFNTAGDSGRIDNVSVLAVATPAADFDIDGDVDLNDFSFFQVCFRGPNQPIAAGCAKADFDSDSDVDLSDFSVFHACFNGPNRPPVCG